MLILIVPRSVVLELKSIKLSKVYKKIVFVRNTFSNVLKLIFINPDVCQIPFHIVLNISK